MKIENLKQEDGKQLPAAWRKTLQKLILNGKLQAEYLDTTVARRNPYSGVTREIPLEAAALLDWIVSINPIGNGTKFTRADWDNARYTFNVVWPEAYYALVD